MSDENFAERPRAIRFSTLESICVALECQPGDLLTFRPNDPCSTVRRGASSAGYPRRHMSVRMRLAVLVSGSGTNLQAIMDAAASPDFGADVAVVISDRPGVTALERASAAGIPTEVVPWRAHRDRSRFSTAICDAAAHHGATALVLAGFLRILSADAIDRFRNRILNIHPSLLPAFPGTIHAVAEALEHGVKVTGVTVHFVDEEVDFGPIIAQECVPVLAGDTEDDLHARIQAVEHRLYPEVVDAFATGRLTVEGRRVAWKEDP